MLLCAFASCAGDVHYPCLQSLDVGLELLTALAEESEVRLSRAGRKAMLSAIGKQADDVLHLIGVVLAANVGAEGSLRSAHAQSHRTALLGIAFIRRPYALCLCAGDPSHVALACKCLQAWMALDVTGGGSTLVPFGQLYAQHSQLFQSLLMALSSPHPACAGQAAEVIIMVVGMPPGPATAQIVSSPQANSSSKPRLLLCVLQVMDARWM